LANFRLKLIAPNFEHKKTSARYFIAKRRFSAVSESRSMKIITLNISR
jgi:hypothetical protein